jgi:hypothetical protein
MLLPPPNPRKNKQSENSTYKNWAEQEIYYSCLLVSIGWLERSHYFFDLKLTKYGIISHHNRVNSVLVMSFP